MTALRLKNQLSVFRETPKVHKHGKQALAISLETTGSTIRFPSYKTGDKRKSWWETGTGHVRGPLAPSGSQATKRETRGNYRWRQGLAISGTPQQHHPVVKLQKARQEEIIMGVKAWPFPGPLAGPSASQATRQEEIMMGDQDWRFPETPGSTIRCLKKNPDPLQEIVWGRKQKPDIRLRAL